MHPTDSPCEPVGPTDMPPRNGADVYPEKVNAIYFFRIYCFNNRERRMTSKTNVCIYKVMTKISVVTTIKQRVKPAMCSFKRFTRLYTCSQ